MTISSIDPRELNAFVAAGNSVTLIDVRTPKEFREVHVSFAVNVPLHLLDAAKLVESNRESSTPIYVICRSGARGRQACEKLAAAGCKCAVNVEGGTLAWDQACLPVKRGQKTISLERQVRIVAER